MVAESDKKNRLDWKWIVIGGGIISRIVTTGTINCMGVFFDDIKRSFPDASNAQLSVVFSSAPGLLEGTGVLASFLMTKIKGRYLVIFGAIVATIGVLIASQTTNYFALLMGLGVMNGMGQGLARCILPIAITFSFDDKTRHIAFAILNGGDGVGGVLSPILMNFLIGLITWRNTMLIVAGIIAHLVISGCTVPLNLKTTNTNTARKASTVIMRDEAGSEREAIEPNVPLFPNILFFYTNILTHSIGYFIFMTFIFSDMKEQNMAPHVVSAIVAGIGGVSILGRISVGIMDNQKVRRWVIYMTGHIIRSFVVLGISIIQFNSEQSKIIGYAVLCAMYGLTDGVTGSLIPLICVDLFGLTNFGTVLGWEMFLMGSGAILGVPIAGAMKDYFKSYKIPFMFSAFSFLFAGLVLIPLFWTKKRYQMVPMTRKQSMAERKFSL